MLADRPLSERQQESARDWREIMAGVKRATVEVAMWRRALKEATGLSEEQWHAFYHSHVFIWDGSLHPMWRDGPPSMPYIKEQQPEPGTPPEPKRPPWANPTDGKPTTWQ